MKPILPEANLNLFTNDSGKFEEAYKEFSGSFPVWDMDTVQRLIDEAYDAALEDVAAFVEKQRNDIPATGIEFAGAIRAMKGN